MRTSPSAPPSPPGLDAAATATARRPAAAAPAPEGRGGRRFLALWAAAVGLPLLGFALAALAAWLAVRAEAEVRLWRTLDVMHEHALRAVQTQEVILAATDAALLGRGWEEIALSEDVFAVLRRLEASAPSIYGIALVGPDGRLAATSRGPFPVSRLDLTDRDYVRAHRAGRAEPFVSAIITTRPSGTRVFGISRGRTGEDGRPDGGAIASSFTPEHFTAFYEALAEGRNDSLSLVREDGSLLARRPAPPLGVGDGPRPDGPLTRAWRAAAPADRGALDLAMSFDGVARRVAFRRVGDYPLYVTYGQGAADLRAAWLDRLWPIVLVCGLAATLLLALTALARRAVGREAAALAAAAAEAAHARAEVEARAEAEARLRQAERVGALGQVAAGIAHDFNNLVQSVLAASRLLGRRAEDPAEVRRVTALLGDAAARGARVVHRMLDYARREAGDAEGGGRFDPAPALRRLDGLLAGALGPGVALRVEVPDGELPPVHGDRAELETVLVNLVGNARDALPPGGGGEIRVGAAREAVPSAEAAAAGGAALSFGGYLRVTVADTGAGMAPEVLARVGEPFFTTKPAGKGTGLGLSLARRFAERAGGALHVASRPGEGTAVTLWLREATDGTPPPAELADAAPPPAPVAG